MHLTDLNLAFYASRVMELWQFRHRRLIVAVVAVLATIVCSVSLALAIPKILRKLARFLSVTRLITQRR